VTCEYIFIGKEGKRQKQRVASLLLLGDADCATPPACGLCVLTTDTDAPVVAETTVGADLLQSLQVLAKLVVQEVRQNLGGLAVLDVLLPVEEPVWDLVLTGVGDDCNDPLDLIFTQFTSAFAHVNVGLLQGNVGEPPSNTLDCSDGEHSVPLSLQIGVHHTQDVLEVVWRNQRHLDEG